MTTRRSNDPTLSEDGIDRGEDNAKQLKKSAILLSCHSFCACKIEPIGAVLHEAAVKVRRFVILPHINACKTSPYRPIKTQRQTRKLSRYSIKPALTGKTPPPAAHEHPLRSH